MTPDFPPISRVPPALPEPRPFSRLLYWVDRHITLTVFVVALGLLCLGFSGSLDDPPYWDAVWTTGAGAAELARTDMDFFALIRQPEFVDAGPGTHSTSLVTNLTGLLLNATNPATWIVLLHIANLLIGAALAAATFSLARDFVSRSLALLTAAATVSLPMMLQQIADPYLELPLALLAVLALKAAVRNNLPLATLSAMVAIAIKPSGLALLAVLPFAAGQRSNAQQRTRILASMVIASSPVAVFLVRQLAYQARPVLADSPLSTLTSSAVNLILAPDVLAIVTGGGVAAWSLRKRAPDLARSAGSVLAAFAILYLATVILTRSIAFLSRYLVMILPIAMVLIGVNLSKRSSDVARGVLTGLVALSLVNSTGILYPLPNRPAPTSAERSLAAQTYLDMEVADTRALVEAPVELLVTDLHMHFRLSYPELGFAPHSPEHFTRDTDLPSPMPDSFAWISEPHTSEMENTLTDLAESGGYSLTRRIVHNDRWISQLVIASR